MSGLGVPVAVVGGWMLRNGYDNAEAGLRALITGEPQDTSLHQMRRVLGSAVFICS